MATTNVEIGKMALSLLGESANDVTSIDSPSSQREILCARFYTQALKKALTEFNWSFATRKRELTIYDADDVDAILNGEWAFVYAAPSDLLKLIKILPEGAEQNLPSEDFEIIRWRPEAATPSSTDTVLEQLTFAAVHTWVDGTPVTVSTTAGGLTAGTTYYVHKISTTEISLHTTAANAIADTSRVNLTASITATLTPSEDAVGIATNLDGAWIDYIRLVTDTTEFVAAFDLALAYLLASMLALPVTKGKIGLAVSQAMYQMYKREALAGGAVDFQKQISKNYKDHKPTFWSERGAGSNWTSQLRNQQ